MMRDNSSAGGAGRQPTSGGWASSQDRDQAEPTGTTQPFRTTPAPSGSGQDVGEIVDQAQQKVGEAAEQVQEKAGEVVGQVREQAATRLSSQKDQAAGRLWTVAWAFRTVGDNLREQDEPQIAQMTDRVAEQVERATSYLGHRDINQIASDVQRFARQQPALFLGGALALGFLGARFLKSSSRASTYNQSPQSGADFNCPECGLLLLPADYEREGAGCPRCGTSIGLREYYQSQVGASATVGSTSESDFGTSGGYTSSGSMAVGSGTVAVGGTTGSAGLEENHAYSMMSTDADAGMFGGMTGDTPSTANAAGTTSDETEDPSPIRITPYLPTTEA